MMKIAILGLGAMGSRMASRLLSVGHDVTVYNRTQGRDTPLVAAGAKKAATPRAAVAGAEAVIVVVRDDDASRAVWLDAETGALAGLAAGALAIESSTLTPAFVVELGEAIAKHGAFFLDAPVVGSRPQADAGQVIHLVGGDAATLARATPVLAAIGGAVHHAGPVGAGATMKLAVNTLFGAQVAVLAEMLGFLGRSDIALDKAAAILGALPVTSPAAKGAAGLMLAAADAPLFPVDLVEKDFGYTLAAARAHHLDLPVTTAVRTLFADAKAEGLGEANLTAVWRMFAP